MSPPHTYRQVAVLRAAFERSRTILPCAGAHASALRMLHWLLGTVDSSS